MKAHAGFCDRSLERIKVYDDQINWLDVVSFDRRFMRGIVANIKQAAMDLRMESFYAAVQHFGKAGVFADIFDRKSSFTQCFGCAAGGDNLDSRLRENLGERDQAGLV